MVDDVREKVKVKNLKLVVDAKRGLNLFDQWLNQQLDGYGFVVIEKVFEVLEIHASDSGITGILNQGENQGLQNDWSGFVFGCAKGFKHPEKEDC